MYSFPVNVGSTKAIKQQQQPTASNKSSDIGQALKPITTTPSSYENAQQLSQSLYSSFNNENILSQIISSSSNLTNGSNNGTANYFTMRRERSLDRPPMTENFVENYLINPGSNSLRRSYTNNASQSPQNVSAMFNGKIKKLFQIFLLSWKNVTFKLLVIFFMTWFLMVILITLSTYHS